MGIRQAMTNGAKVATAAGIVFVIGTLEYCNQTRSLNVGDESSPESSQAAIAEQQTMQPDDTYKPALNIGPTISTYDGRGQEMSNREKGKSPWFYLRQ